MTASFVRSICWNIICISTWPLIDCAIVQKKKMIGASRNPKLPNLLIQAHVNAPRRSKFKVTKRRKGQKVVGTRSKLLFHRRLFVVVTSPYILQGSKRLCCQRWVAKNLKYLSSNKQFAKSLKTKIKEWIISWYMGLRSKMNFSYRFYELFHFCSIVDMKSFPDSPFMHMS